MRKVVSFFILKPILWFIERFSSAPNRERIFTSLTTLYTKILNHKVKKGFVIPFESNTGRFIIFSDQHKGARNGADDFMVAEPNYLAALDYYDNQKFHFISLGDSEELWENTMLQVMKHNKAAFAAEGKFAKRYAFTKIFGNHDLDWNIDPLAPVLLKEIYSTSIIAQEGAILQTHINGTELNIFCTHGHQGDLQSDGNWFSKFFVAKIWAPLQAYLKINPNTPAYEKDLKTFHNRIMYDWTIQQKDLILITGHTHQPVFESLTLVERLERKRRIALHDHNPEWAQALEDEISWRRVEENVQSEDYMKTRPSYFNAGCCCFNDGDITGIEIAEGFIRLVKWKKNDDVCERIVLHEKSLHQLALELA